METIVINRSASVVPEILTFSFRILDGTIVLASDQVGPFCPVHSPI